MSQQGLRLNSFFFVFRNKLTVSERNLKNKSFRKINFSIYYKIFALAFIGKRKSYPSSAVLLWDETLESQLMLLIPMLLRQVYLISITIKFHEASQIKFYSTLLHATPPSATKTTRNLSDVHWPQQSLPERSDVDLKHKRREFFNVMRC